jgi:putative transposase
MEAADCDVAGFEVLPKPWIIERKFAWVSRNRRLAEDFACYATTVAAFVRFAMIRIMLRPLAASAPSSIRISRTKMPDT